MGAAERARTLNGNNEGPEVEEEEEDDDDDDDYGLMAVAGGVNSIANRRRWWRARCALNGGSYSCAFVAAEHS